MSAPKPKRKRRCGKEFLGAGCVLESKHEGPCKAFLRFSMSERVTEVTWSRSKWSALYAAESAWRAGS